jgi:threonine dehydratase
MNPPVTVHDVFVARSRLAGRIRRTPLVHSAWLSGISGADVWLKLESLQVTHAFKVRGALNAVMRLAEQAAPGGTRGVRVVTASAGNHGQALAWAARQADLDAVVFTPRDAAVTKLEAIRSFGADLRPVAENYDAAERMAIDMAREEGALYVSPYDHPDVVAGGGTVGLEILEDLPRLDGIVCPVGGGGLISGIATVVAAIAPTIRLTGVEAALNPAFKVAVDRGCVTTIPVFPSIADGLGGNVHPDTITFPIIRDLVSDLTSASEAELLNAIRQLLAHEHLVAEGAGAAGVAAVMAGRGVSPSQRVAVLVTGANIDLARLSHALAGSGRAGVERS